MNMKMDLNIQSFQSLGKQARNVVSAYRLIIVIALNLVVFGAVIQVAIRPQFAEKQKLAAQYQTVKADVDRMTEIKNNMPKYRKEFALVKAKLEEVLAQLPESKDIPNLLRSVSAVGTESKVKVTYFEPGTVQPKEFYGEFPFKIRYNGGFHNIGYFFDGIRKADRMIDITDFSLAAKGPPNKIVLEGECVAKSYIYAGQAPQQPPRKK